ncbi:MAG TPA: hypothetical protein VIF43_00590 [Patescibacteria group bacterium]|jgi:hypothetical protein
MIESEEKFVDPDLARELTGEELPEPDPEGDPSLEEKPVEDYVGGEFVGDRQLTVLVREDEGPMEYRIGFCDQGIVYDRRPMGTSPADRPTPIDRDAAPKLAQEAADGLLMRYVPEAREVLRKQQGAD